MSKMVMATEPCSDADFDRAFHIVSDSFQHVQPVIDAIFPKHDTPPGHAHGRDALLQSKKTDSTAHFIKAVNQDTGEITGIAKWLILQGQAAQPLPPGQLLETDEEKEYAEHLLSEYQQFRSEVIKSTNGHLLILDLLAVDPKFQRHGAGSLLVEWGTDHADQLGLDAVVEASTAGVPVYQKCGFRPVTKMELNLPKKFASKPMSNMLFMRRPAKSSNP